MSNGTGTLKFGTTPFDNTAAILPFSPPPIAYEVSMDVAIEPERIGDWLGVGFSSSNAVNHNLETAGQAWMQFKMNNPGLDSFSGTVELHVNGMTGPSITAPVTRLNFDTMTVRVDPVTNMVSGYWNGNFIGSVPYTAVGVHFVGFEGSTAGPDFLTVDNFIVKASH